jgi:Flp pilus assembly protein TadG
MKKRRQTFMNNQSGALAVMVALLMTVLLSAAALSVDYGHISWVQSELKKAAEAGALAGASVLMSASNPAWSAGQAAATAIVQQNKAAGQLLTDCQVDYGYWSKLTHTLQSSAITPQKTDAPAIRVLIRKFSGENGGPVQLLFAPIFGVNTLNLSGRAVAMLKSSSGLWSILETGNGTVTISNNADVKRDVGICGTGATNINNNAIVEGGLYLNKNTPDPSIGNNAVVQDGIKHDDSAAATLQAASQAATNAYNNFVGLSNNKGTITTVNTTRTLPNGSSGTNVLDVTNFRPSNNAIITITSPAGSSYVIRISSTFTLNNNSQIKLTGGITSDRVTFVYKGTGTVTLSNNSILYGSILSPSGAITVSNNATIKDGVLVSGKNISLNNNSVATTKTPWLPSSGGTQGAVLVN